MASEKDLERARGIVESFKQFLRHDDIEVKWIIKEKIAAAFAEVRCEALEEAADQLREEAKKAEGSIAGGMLMTAAARCRKLAQEQNDGE